MWIYRIVYCLFQGHSFIDITTSVRPYQYCLRCGKVKEPSAFLKAVPAHVHVNTRNERY